MNGTNSAPVVATCDLCCSLSGFLTTAVPGLAVCTHCFPAALPSGHLAVLLVAAGYLGTPAALLLWSPNLPDPWHC